jgi:hypothetical protein
VLKGLFLFSLLFSFLFLLDFFKNIIGKNNKIDKINGKERYWISTRNKLK